MRGNSAEDVMDSLLSGNEPEHAPMVEELNCLIYRNAHDLPDNCALMAEEQAAESTAEKAATGQIYTASKDKVTVQVWESRASIRIKASRPTSLDISMHRIAEIAVKAIVDELRRDTE